MEFGRVPEAELDKVDFSLPEEPVFNKKVLTGSPVQQPEIYVGCARWGKEEWVGKIYPPRTKEKDFSQHYVEQFNCIEHNATHYKIYGESGIKKWADVAKGKDFLYCPKMFNGVTHSGDMNDNLSASEEFIKSIMGLGEHLGPVFIQLSDAFSPGRKKELFTYLSTLPSTIQFFLEVRHPAWFSVPKDREELFTFLKDHNIGAVITDTMARRDCSHMYVTVPKTFIRYVGNDLHKTDYKRIDSWVERLKYWLDHGMKEIYFFMHDQGTSPEMIVYMADVMKKITGLDLKKPMVIDPSSIQQKPKQTSLF